VRHRYVLSFDNYFFLPFWNAAEKKGSTHEEERGYRTIVDKGQRGGAEWRGAGARGADDRKLNISKGLRILRERLGAGGRRVMENPRAVSER